ncbi:hypothetical protein JN01_0249 [Entomoplasma freundtii]|uniref:Uncharacterized protein n=1 Tax=Entomoplasma freundtii TaxID=74700 RepID=A0A2K8NUV1_9MOLU|nr:hypothetical protein [Entomoplasma freundtii]ATZ16541.1 hypothetical protein EFREU_v1c05200 [Entomoplasma freundtii]TDY58293.1 hypothetical protein JN01_0249 [Entomoplasma freundtii]
MDWNRTWASLLNWIGTIFVVNIILWLWEKPLLGERLFKVPLPKGRLNLFLFGLLTFLIFITVAGWLANIVFWIYNKNSIPTIIFYRLID